MRERLVVAVSLALVLVVHGFASAQTTPQATGAAPPRVTLEEAVRTALEKNPTVAGASQAILRAEALLMQARTVYRPSLDGSVLTTVLDNERGFNGQAVQPQAQTLLSASLSYPLIAASRWAARAQAEDQVRVAQLSVTEVRRQIAVATALAYLAVIAQQRQVEVNLLARENAQAHVDYARARVQGGAGSRLDELRAMQEFSVDEVLVEAAGLAQQQAQEALGVLMATEGPVDAAEEPAFEIPIVPAADAWLADRADVQLFSAQVGAAERVFRDSWRDWVPTATAAFEPQLLTPSGLFQPSRTWRGFVAVQIPMFDGGSRRATERLREVALGAARIDLSDVQLRARAELRTAQVSVESTERALVHARQAAQSAADVLRITDIAVRAGATSNIELIDAQRRARESDTAVAIAENRLRQARLVLLVALGRFPR